MTSERMPQPEHERPIDDLVHLDTMNRAYRPDGKLMTAYQQSEIAAHQEQIRFGLAGHETMDEKQRADDAKNEALMALANLDEGGQVLDARALRGIGITYESRMQMGYHGSLDTMLKDAHELKTARDEAQAKQDAQAAEVKRISEYHAHNKAQADTWKQEKDQMRERRLAADKAIAEAVSGEDVVNNLTYKQRLEKGGEISMKRVAEENKLGETAAVEYVRDVLNMDVSHRAPRHYHVTQNAKVEARAADMAARLKAMVPAPTHVAVEQIEPETTVPVVYKRTSDGLEPVLPAGARVLTPGSRPIVEAFNAAYAENAASSAEVSDDIPSFLDLFREAEKNVTPQQAQDGTVHRSPKNVRSLWNKFKVYMSGKNQDGSPKSPEDQKAARRRQGLAWVAAVSLVAVAAATRMPEIAALIGDHDTANTLAGSGGFGSSNHNVAGRAAEVAARIGAHDSVTDTGQLQNTVTLSPGDTIWAESNRALGGHASVESIDRVKDAALRLNGVTEMQVEHAQIGSQWRMPVEVIQEEFTNAKQS